MREYFKKKIAGVPVWVYLVALLPRIILFFLVYRNLDFCIKLDSLGYIELASNFIGGFGFSRFENAVLSPETFRTPGYPFFLALLLLFPGKIAIKVAFVQIIISAVTVIMAWKWFEKITPGRGAVIGFILFSLDYIYLMHVPLVLAETLLVFVLLAASMYLWDSIKIDSLSRTLISGILWSIASFIKPVCLYLPFILSFLWWRRKKYMIVFLTFSYALPLAWTVRNYIKTGYFVYSSLDGITILRYPAAEIIARKTLRTWAEVDFELRTMVDAMYKEGYKNDAHKSAVYREIGINIIKEEPFLFARYIVWGLVKTIAGTGMEMLVDLLKLDRQKEFSQIKSSGIGSGTRMLLAEHPWLWIVQIFYMLFLAFMYFSCVLGFYKIIKTGLKSEIFFLAAVIFYFFIMASSQGYYRYRIPALPFIAACSSMLFWKKRFIPR